jgi:hypothetical protein
MKTFSKQPREVIDYEISFRNYFKKFAGDEINTVTVTHRNVAGGTSDLVIGPNALPDYELPGTNPTWCKVWVGGGSAENTYIVSVLIGTNAGRVVELDFKVRVREL